MNYLHWEYELDEGQPVEILLDAPANVRLLDPENYDHYVAGREHRYRGGYAETSPIRLTAPHRGRWHVIVDLGGYPGHVAATAYPLEASRQHH